MRGVRCTKDGIAVLDLPDDERPGVRVTVASSGICGSDVHLASFGPSACTFGHEFCGRLDDGTPVAVLPIVTCGRCERCLRGDEQQCQAALGAMYGVSLDGGMAEAAWVDPACTKPLPPGLSLDDACLVEPIAVALHGCNRAGVGPSTRTLVVGGGPIGLCAVATARAAGATVDVLAHRSERVAAAERLGAGTSPADGYDVVIEAAGTQGSLDAAIDRVRPGGTVSIVGSYWDPVAIGLGFQMKEVTLLPSFTYGHHHGSDEFVDAMAVLAGAPDLPAAVITHRLPLDAAAEAFGLASDRGRGAIKVVLHP